MVCLPPPGEQSLLSVTAEKFFLVHRDRPKRLEGTTFDKNGDMYFTSNYTGRVYKLDMNTLELRVYGRTPTPALPASNSTVTAECSYPALRAERAADLLWPTLTARPWTCSSRAAT